MTLGKSTSHLHRQQRLEPCEGMSILGSGRPTTLTIATGHKDDIADIVDTKIRATFVDIVCIEIHAAIANIVSTKIHVAITKPRTSLLDDMERSMMPVIGRLTKVEGHMATMEEIIRTLRM